MTNSEQLVHMSFNLTIGKFSPVMTRRGKVGEIHRLCIEM